MRSASSNVQPLEVLGKIVRVTEEGDECFLIGINIAEIDSQSAVIIQLKNERITLVF
jgi:hypothetical protein